MSINIEIDQTFLEHMVSTDLGDVSVSRMPVKQLPNGAEEETAYKFATMFGDILFSSRNGRYEVSAFTGEPSHKQAVFNIFCDVCDSFDAFKNSYTPIGFTSFSQ